MSDKDPIDRFGDKLADRFGDKFADKFGDKFADLRDIEIEAIQSPRDIATGQATGKRQFEPIRLDGDKAHDFDKLVDGDGSEQAWPKLADSDGDRSWDPEKLVDKDGFEEVAQKLADRDYEEIAFGKIKEVAPKLADRDYEEVAFGDKHIDLDGRPGDGLVTELGFPVLDAGDGDEMVDLGSENSITWDAGTGKEGDVDLAPQWNDGGITAEDDWEAPAAVQEDTYTKIEWTLTEEPTPSDFATDEGDGYAIELGGATAGIFEDTDGLDGLG